MRIYKIATELASFLSTPQQAWEWAKENVDIEFTEDDLRDTSLSESERNRLESHIEMNKERASLYSIKYNYIKKNSGNIVIYRVIKVLSFDNIDWDNIGTHWSFEKEGAGAYGDIRPNIIKKGADILLTGMVNVKDIDWAYCFTSFMYYGEAQWECALDDGAKVIITHVNNEKLNSPIQAEAWNSIA